MTNRCYSIVCIHHRESICQCIVPSLVTYTAGITIPKRYRSSSTFDQYHHRHLSWSSSTFTSTNGTPLLRSNNSVTLRSWTEPYKQYELRCLAYVGSCPFVPTNCGLTTPLGVPPLCFTSRVQCCRLTRLTLSTLCSSQSWIARHCRYCYCQCDYFCQQAILLSNRNLYFSFYHLCSPWFKESTMVLDVSSSISAFTRWGGHALLDKPAGSLTHLTGNKWVCPRKRTISTTTISCSIRISSRGLVAALRAFLCEIAKRDLTPCDRVTTARLLRYRIGLVALATNWRLVRALSYRLMVSPLRENSFGQTIPICKQLS